jgi:16S rRNA (cytosine967-C5)-methyltransferase
MRFHSYFNTAVLLLGQYDGKQPLTIFLKAYFAKHKKYGSKDRKAIMHLCYTYFRIGHAVKNVAVEERLKIAIFITTDQAGDWAVLYDNPWITNWYPALAERLIYLQTLYPAFTIESIFPWHEQLSSGIDVNAFVLTHFQQPNLFLRIRPGKESRVIKQISELAIEHQISSGNCLALPNGSKIDGVLSINQDVVIQDISSQRVASLLSLVPHVLQNPIHVWDCCAASGGKSILAKDVLKNIDLTVSDIRASIIQNLKKRFAIAGITKYAAFISDLSQPKPVMPVNQPDLIICDAPCSGSGTWGRTPEQLYFFNEAQISSYAKLQANILQNVIPALKKGGHLLYITCSVFQTENEASVKLIQEEQGLTLIKAELLKGYEEKGDTMFASLFCKK